MNRRVRAGASIGRMSRGASISRSICGFRLDVRERISDRPSPWSSAMPTPSIEQSVHVISGASAAGSLRQAWGRDFIILRDPLCPGPCNVKPARHRQQREAYLRGYLDGMGWRNRRACEGVAIALAGHSEGLRVRRPPRRLPSGPARTAVDRPVLARPTQLLVDARCREPLATVAGPLLDCGTDPAGTGTDGRRTRGDALGQYPSRCLRDAVATLRPLGAEMLRAGTALWRAFAGRSATAFDVARRQGRRYFADLPRVTHGYGCLLPQIVGRRPVRLLLSEFDQALFDALRPDAWQRPVDLLRSSNRRLIDFFGYYGDLLLPRRLWEWGQHCPHRPAVLSRAESRCVNEFTANSFQLTPLGVRLRDEGLHGPARSTTPVYRRLSPVRQPSDLGTPKPR